MQGTFVPRKSEDLTIIKYLNGGVEILEKQRSSRNAACSQKLNNLLEHRFV